jgi:hypothetical protein
VSGRLQPGKVICKTPAFSRKTEENCRLTRL